MEKAEAENKSSPRLCSLIPLIWVTLAPVIPGPCGCTTVSSYEFLFCTVCQSLFLLLTPIEAVCTSYCCYRNCHKWSGL